MKRLLCFLILILSFTIGNAQIKNYSENLSIDGFYILDTIPALPVSVGPIGETVQLADGTRWISNGTIYQQIFVGDLPDFVDLTTSQVIGGLKTFSNSVRTGALNVESSLLNSFKLFRTSDDNQGISTSYNFLRPGTSTSYAAGKFGISISNRVIGSETTQAFISLLNNGSDVDFTFSGSGQLSMSGAFVTSALSPLGSSPGNVDAPDGTALTADGFGGSSWEVVPPDPIPSLQAVTDIGGVTTNPIEANQFVKTGGLSDQFLKADGSIDGTAYLSTIPDLDDVLNAGRVSTIFLETGHHIIKTSQSEMLSLSSTLDPDFGNHIIGYSTRHLRSGGASDYESFRFRVVPQESAVGLEDSNFEMGILKDGSFVNYVFEDDNFTTPGNIDIAGSAAIGGAPVSGTLLNILHDDSGSGGIQLQSSLLDNTVKVGIVKCAHYDNSEEPFTLVRGICISSENQVLIGGGSNFENAATKVILRAAANNTTLDGTDILTADINGVDIDGSVDVDDVLSLGVWSNGVSTARFGHINHNTIGGYGLIQQADGAVFISAPTGFSVYQSVNNNIISQVSNLGLSITGDITASVDVNCVDLNYSGALNNVSDKRVKDSIRDFVFDRDAFKCLSTKIYNYKADSTNIDYINPMAQALEVDFPWLVNHSDSKIVRNDSIIAISTLSDLEKSNIKKEDRLHTIKSMQLSVMAMEGLRLEMIRNDSLKLDIEVLKSLVKNLGDRLNTLEN